MQVDDKFNGRFHSHITVNGDVGKMAEWARDSKGKITIIHLEKGEQAQVDVMGAFYFASKEPVTIKEVEKYFFDIARKAKDYELEYVRIKVEVDNIPEEYSETVDELTHYWESHIKLNLHKDIDNAEIADILEDDWVFSKNTLPHKLADRKYQFINLRRSFRIDIEESAYLASEILEKAGYTVEEMKVEAVIVDTNKALDSWWE